MHVVTATQEFRPQGFRRVKKLYEFGVSLLQTDRHQRLFSQTGDDFMQHDPHPQPEEMHDFQAYGKNIRVNVSPIIPSSQLKGLWLEAEYEFSRLSVSASVVY